MGLRNKKNSSNYQASNQKRTLHDSKIFTSPLGSQGVPEEDEVGLDELKKDS